MLFRNAYKSGKSKEKSKEIITIKVRRLLKGELGSDQKELGEFLGAGNVLVFDLG